jgi:hypothetical protein
MPLCVIYRPNQCQLTESCDVHCDLLFTFKGINSFYSWTPCTHKQSNQSHRQTFWNWPQVFVLNLCIIIIFRVYNWPKKCICLCPLLSSHNLFLIGFLGDHFKDRLECNVINNGFHSIKSDHRVIEPVVHTERPTNGPPIVSGDTTVTSTRKVLAIAWQQWCEFQQVSVSSQSSSRQSLEQQNLARQSIERLTKCAKL